MKTIYYFKNGEVDEEFVKLPKAFYKNDDFKGLSKDGMLLYSIMLDRARLSEQNGWYDDDERVYVVYTIKEIMNTIGCKKTKATKLLRELQSFSLIERKHTGIGSANLIFVKRILFASCGKPVEKSVDNFDTCS